MRALKNIKQIYYNHIDKVLDILFWHCIGLMVAIGVGISVVAITTLPDALKAFGILP